MIIHHTLHQREIEFLNLIQVEAENIKLAEENERLSEQVFSIAICIECILYIVLHCIEYYIFSGMLVFLYFLQCKAVSIVVLPCIAFPSIALFCILVLLPCNDDCR